MELDETRQMGSMSYRGGTDGIPLQNDFGKQMPYAEMPSWIDTLQNGIPIIIEDVNTWREDKSVEKQMLLDKGIPSLIAVPLKREGALIGMLSVIHPRRVVRHVEYLLALGDYVIVLLEQRELLIKIEQENEAMLRLMNDTPGGFARMKLLPDGGVAPVFINAGFCRLRV